MIKTEVFRSPSELPPALRETWAVDSSIAFDQTYEWYEFLFEHVLSENYKFRLITVSDTSTGQYNAVLPLMLSRKVIAVPGLFTLRSLTNYYSSTFEPIVFNNVDVAAACNSLVVALTELGRDARYLEFEPMPSTTALYEKWSSALSTRGYLIAHHRRFTNWFHRTEGQSFDDYLASREGSLRNTYKRKEKKLRKGRYKLDILTDLDSLALALDDYETVYRQSWKGVESHPDFVRELCKIAATQGWLRLGILRYRGEPVAAQIWLVKDRVASIYKLAYVESHKLLSAGTVLTMALIQHVLDIDRVRLIDYLTGDDAYKSQYMSESREMHSIIAYQRRSLAAISGYLSSLKTSIKKLKGGRVRNSVSIL